ncbi:MAG: hypothetical protein AAB421_04200 [Patescibacteria group bacterium]
MELSLTKKQFWALMRATYIADWMTNAIHSNMDVDGDASIKEVRNLVFSRAKEMGYGAYTEYHDDIGYCATLDMDDNAEVRSRIVTYDEHVFWDELCEQLGGTGFLPEIYDF